MGVTFSGGETSAEWHDVPLAELYEFKNGVNADSSAYGKGIPFINVLEAITFSHLPDDAIAGRISLPEATIAAYEVCKGDLVFNRTSETAEEVGLAAAYIGDERVVFGGFVIRARPLGRRVDSAFAAYALRAPVVRSQIIAMGQGAVRANIGQDNLRRVVLRVPPLEEQRAIAGTLSDADALIDSLEGLLTTKRQIKQGAMQELLTGKRRLPGFDGMWISAPLADLGTWVGGMTPSMANVDYWTPAEVPWLSSGDIKSSRLSSSAQAVSQLAVRSAATTLVPSGSVVVVMRSGILRKHLPVALTSIPMAINQDLKALVPKKSVVAEFVLQALINAGNQVLAQCLKSGTTVESIEFGWLKRFVIQVPSVEEQRAIAQVLSDLDADIAATEARLAKARDLKQAMMQVLLTGRIRLVGADAGETSVPA